MAAALTLENRRLGRLLWKTRRVAPYRSWWISTADYWMAVAVVRAWLDGTIMTLDRDLLLKVAGRKK